MRRRWPDTVLGQMLAIVFAAVITVFLVGAVAEDGFDRLTNHGLDDDDYLRQLAFLAVALRQQPPDALAQSLEALSATGIEGRILATSPDIAPLPADIDWQDIALCCPQLPAPAGAARIDGKAMLLFTLSDGRALAFPDSVAQGAGTEFFYYPLATAVLVLGLSVFAVWGVSRPVRKLAASLGDTETFLSGETAVPERGPREFRHLARALNRMRARIRQLLDSRTRMLRGISHDLRTPLTRLKLRVERMEDSEERRHALSDIEQLDRMIAGTLRYLRDGSSEILWETCDLSSLLHSICDDFADTGARISFEGPERLDLEGGADELMRSFSNLCENGLKFGTEVAVSLRREGDRAVVEIADDGPGIPPDMRDKVLEPFAKLDPARSGRTGYGLGLAIAAEIVTRHRGTLTLEDNNPSGLRVRVTLPLRHR